jgi:hypothetical protein
MIRLIALLIEASGWFRIVASPLIVGLGLGAWTCFNDPRTLTLVCGIFVALLGLVVGVLWAARVWKKTGTIEFLSRVGANPELNKPDDEFNN